ncbi:MAG: MBL fold metallo-hydrolase [Microbacteriaceae bacterium]|jgi:L-ascorbate metabolism protein UlaG (beta-lactamase superfamily)|nr:MBL fold metallo-hydrolase [Microbacteriaceae bacterium]MDR9443829.1 MBL fold metallo-hydrolase [Microbacteriaceae bacterium]
MKITKLTHACLKLENNSYRIWIDPGNFTKDFLPEKAEAVIITHLHDDHCHQPNIEKLLELNPDTKIFSTAEVKEKLEGLDVTVVQHGDLFELDGFSLEFFGDLHQEIHHSIPLVQNTAVMVNKQFYYPGDSYTPPEYRPEMLAVPASAPWLKIADVIDYLNLVKPKKAFPTHNALLSEIGHNLQNSRIQQIVEDQKGEFRYLQPGDFWDL